MITHVISIPRSLLPWLARAFTIALAVNLLPWSNSHAADTERVAVYATADEEYVEHKFPKEGSVPESYIFYQGSFLKGTSRDASIAEFSFQDLVSTLAVDLAKQDYYPAPEPKDADLLIVVHWGTTAPGTVDTAALDALMDQTNTMLEAQANDPTIVVDMFGIEATRRAYQMSVDQAISENAKILGYTKALNKERHRRAANRMGDREQQLREELVEDRYFVVLTAWDNQALLKKREPRLLWSTRFSMRAVGKNFIEALPALSRVAGNYFGRQLDDLETERTHLGGGNVEYGEMEILGTEAAPTPSPTE